MKPSVRLCLNTQRCYTGYVFLICGGGSLRSLTSNLLNEEKHEQTLQNRTSTRHSSLLGLWRGICANCRQLDQSVWHCLEKRHPRIVLARQFLDARHRHRRPRWRTSCQSSRQNAYGHQGWPERRNVLPVRKIHPPTRRSIPEGRSVE